MLTHGWLCDVLVPTCRGVATAIKKSREQLEERPTRGLGMYPDEVTPVWMEPHPLRYKLIVSLSFTYYLSSIP